MMKKVLLTGSGGFIGTEISRLLSSRYEVLSPFSRNSCDFHDDLQVKKIVDNFCPDYCLHLAWETRPGIYWNSEENLRWLSSSLYFLQNLARSGVKRIVTAGSCAEYSWENASLIQEDFLCNPVTLYGEAKNSLFRLYRNFCKNRNISYAHGRIFHVFGPFENKKRLVPFVINQVLKGEKALCSSGVHLRDFMYVKDLASAFLSLMESDFEGACNLASAQKITTGELIKKIGALMNREDLICLGGISDRVNDPDVLTASTDCLNQRVGFTESWSLESSLQETIQWWRSQ